MNALLSITKRMQVPRAVMFNLFDPFVLSILNYSCEVWGFYTAQNIERVHRKFCKWLMNVKMSTNNLFLAGEFCRFPIYIGGHVRIIKNWLYLYHSKADNCILRTLNNTARTEVDAGKNMNSWTAKVKNVLQRSVLFFFNFFFLFFFFDVWIFPESVNINVLYPYFMTDLKTCLYQIGDRFKDVICINIV